MSFGSDFKYLSNVKEPLEYNQENIDLATTKINNFSADLGGTDMFKPLKAALNLEPPKGFTNAGGYQKMIYLLTDGETEDQNKCYKLAQEDRPENTTIHSFGIGDDCDQKFVTKIS